MEVELRKGWYIELLEFCALIVMSVAGRGAQHYGREHED